MLNPMSSLSAEIEEQPHDPLPQSLEQLRKGANSTDSYYLIPQTEGFCAYPIRPLGVPHFTPMDLFPTEVSQLPPFFGKPTSLPVHWDLHPNAAIYEPYVDQAYLPDIRGMRWYLVGEGRRYEQMLDGISEYAYKLLKEWRSDREAMMRHTWPIPEDFEPSQDPAPDYLTAWIEMGKLGNWLRENDPKLWAEAFSSLVYSPTMPSNGCANAITEDSHAYYSPGDNRIVLLPRSIRLLKEGQYAAVAQTLAHEVSHRDNMQIGLVMPSEEMMQRSLDLFRALVYEESPIWGMALALAGKDFYDAMFCNRLPMVPEEELDAFSADLSYGHSLDPRHRSQETVEESREAVEYLIQQIHREFPPQWDGLLADYLRLADANHAQARKTPIY